MTKTIVNLTLPVVTAKIEEILANYSYPPYQQVFSISELHQKLLSYVLSRMPGMYAVLDESELSSINARKLCHTLEQRQHIEALIHQGIQDLLNLESDWIDRYNREKVNSSVAPSNWFG